ncbi:heptahelical transmembrane protein2 [Perilla frutescens var. hirtella]|uniref:Heptahelical transmembrane protein2 n=1 Tax=Perilla frutescens var. hirtella TaxID=608512 RepID=A0AAD4JLB2_PERFH|nr:heptahelical transmembrane protein2 [Perilla frutescens var. hirtella]
MSFSAGGCDKKVKPERKVVLVNFEELPEYLKDNEFIRNYYRCEWPLKDVALSIFSCHNETINIWTHLIGFFIFSKILIMSLTQKTSLRNVLETFFGDGSDGWLPIMIHKSNSSRPHLLLTDSYVGEIGRLDDANIDSTLIPIWPWLVLLGGAMSCLILSSISHLLGCHSRRFHYLFWRLDYTGISLMIVCSFFTPIYYIFPDHPYCRFFYLSSVTLVGAAVVVTLLAPSLNTAHSRSFRATLFLCMGFSGVIPATHALILHWDHPQILISLFYELVMALFYGVGALVYVARIPERWKPGAFDILGHSHQIFHVLVVAAALAHCAATLIIMDWRRALPAHLTTSL